jgi:uncharacterized protein YbaP (TraB family)
MLKRCFLKSRLNVVLFVFFLPAFFITATFCWQIKPAAGQEAQKSCLWSIEGRSNKIHLLGSLHFFKPDAFPLAVSIEKAYAESERLVFETDLAAMQDPAVQARMMALGMYPEGQDRAAAGVIFPVQTMVCGCSDRNCSAYAHGL